MRMWLGTRQCGAFNHPSQASQQAWARAIQPQQSTSKNSLTTSALTALVNTPPKLTNINWSQKLITKVLSFDGCVSIFIIEAKPVVDQVLQYYGDKLFYTLHVYPLWLHRQAWIVAKVRSLPSAHQNSQRWEIAHEICWQHLWLSTTGC